MIFLLSTTPDIGTMASPAPWIIAGVLASIHFLLGIANRWDQWRGRNRVPQPMEVKEAQRLTSHEEHKALEKRVDGLQVDMSALREQITTNYNTLMTESSAGRARLHSKIEDVSKALTAEVRALTGAVSKMEGTMEAVREMVFTQKDSK